MTTGAPPRKPGVTTLATIQAHIDRQMFEQAPIHIIERFLESFSDDGEMSSPVAPHILEALAIHFRLFFCKDSPLKSLDKAFGGAVARQRQARFKARKIYDVTFSVIVERNRLEPLTVSERSAGGPHEIACENVATGPGMKVDSVRLLYKESAPKNRKRKPE